MVTGMCRIGTAYAVVLATVFSCISFASAEFCNVKIFDPSEHLFVEVDGLKTKSLACEKVEQMSDFDLSELRQRQLTIKCPSRTTPPPSEIIIRLMQLNLRRRNSGQSAVVFLFKDLPAKKVLKQTIGNGIGWLPPPTDAFEFAKSSSAENPQIKSSEWVFYHEKAVYKFIVTEIAGSPISSFYELVFLGEVPDKPTRRKSSQESEDVQISEWINVLDKHPAYADVLDESRPTSAESTTTCLDKDTFDLWFRIAWPQSGEDYSKVSTLGYEKEGVAPLAGWYHRAGVKPPMSPIVWEKADNKPQGGRSVGKLSVFKVKAQPVVPGGEGTTIRRRKSSVRPNDLNPSAEYYAPSFFLGF